MCVCPVAYLVVCHVFEYFKNISNSVALDTSRHNVSAKGSLGEQFFEKEATRLQLTFNIEEHFFET